MGRDRGICVVVIAHPSTDDLGRAYPPTGDERLDWSDVTSDVLWSKGEVKSDHHFERRTFAVHTIVNTKKSPVCRMAGTEDDGRAECRYLRA